MELGHISSFWVDTSNCTAPHAAVQLAAKEQKKAKIQISMPA